MDDTNATMTISPRAGVLLTKMTETPDLEAALWKMLSEYADLKTKALRRQIEAFESK